MSTNMGNLEKLGILVIVILVVVVGVVAITPKTTVDERLYPEQKVADAPTPTETLEPVGPDAKKDDVWPGAEAKPLPGGAANADLKNAAPVDAPAFRTVKVQAHDTFATIAKRELLNAARFKEIQEANPGLVASKLKAGMEIKVPVAPATPPVAKTTPVVPVGPVAQTPPNPVAPPSNVPTPAPDKAEKVYVVKSGDTLSSIATHELGTAKKWQDLAKANEDVLHGSTALKPGMKLQIPAESAPSTAGPSKPVSAADPAPASTPPAVSSATDGATSTSEREYVVKAGDTLSSIATHELGAAKDWQDIAKMNDDVLHGTTALKPGMKLKLPAKK